MQFLTAVFSVHIAAVSAIASPLSQGMHDTLEAMEQAVLAGDSGAYMAQIGTNDAMVLTEQRAWIEDLLLNPVVSFSIESDEVVRYGPNFSPAILSVRFVWELKSDEIERELETQIRLSPMNRNNDGPWHFVGRHWMVGERNPETGVRVFADTQHDDLARSVLEVVPGIQSEIEKQFGKVLGVPLTIKIYPTMQELQFSIAPGYLDPLSGWNEPGESIKILGRDDVSVERISTLLAHEIGHAVSFEFGEQIIDAPWWSLEGIAELVADDYRSDSIEKRELRVAKQVAEGDRRTWDQLSDFKGEALNHTGYVYTHGWSMVRFITQRYGSDKRNEWFAAIGQGASLESATKSVLGVSFEDLDRMWEAELINIVDSADESP